MKLWNNMKRGQKGQFAFRLAHGGAKKTGKRKEARPFIPKKWNHLILKSSKARGSTSLLAKRNKHMVASVVSGYAKKFGAELQQQVNMGNHLHIKIRFFSQEQMRKYLRVVPGIIARKVLGAEKGDSKGRFWDGLAFTRVLTNDFVSRRIDAYLHVNKIERDFGPEARQTALAELSSWMSLIRRMEQGLPVPG
jgi:hypothetical protein